MTNIDMQISTQSKLNILFTFSLLFVSIVSYMLMQTKPVVMADEKTQRISVFKSLLSPLVFKPVSISIPKADIFNAKMVEIRQDPEKSGILGTPKNFNEVGWYVDGAKPGESGNALIAGHYDKPNGAPAVFYHLGRLEVDDVVGIKDEVGRVIMFKIYDVELVTIGDNSSVLKAYEYSDDSILTIITCGGVWDVKARNYTKRLLIKARKVV